MAKTLAVETLAKVVGGSFARVQLQPPTWCRPTSWAPASTGSPANGFDVELGPVFVNFLLADEINRAPAKVQSALLEVMSEGQVSLGGQTHRVPRPFLVMATQNPIEQEGVYPLPEAQRDRFLMKIVVGYPTDAEEREIVYRMGVAPPEPAPVFTTADLTRAATQGRNQVFVHNALVDTASRRCLATRCRLSTACPDVAHSSSTVPARAPPWACPGHPALALLRGRDYALPQDVQDVAPDILRHRLVQL